MSIRIDQETCIGCGRCAAVCPGTLIDLQGQQAVMKYPKDCWGCAACIKECPFGAIRYFLGADIGGTGSCMYVTTEQNILHWNIIKQDGTKIVVDTDRTNANQY